jgi:hypothetical protein
MATCITPQNTFQYTNGVFFNHFHISNDSIQSLSPEQCNKELGLGLARQATDSVESINKV